ncbi:MAG TPA: amino acid permease [Verrucomicrobiae bacterium]|jgi:amino acid transporter|nr:amino acid permease [Verrucomicrobiae bacterium]
MSSNHISQPPKSAQTRALPRVLIATTAMLAFVSFWRAAAIVLNDMGSSAFYAGAIAEHFIGKTGPWFILAIMCLAYAVRSVYIESCSMFVRGGVYRVVKEAMGSTLAKISVSALMFDYILTGPISGVSAGLYLVGLLNELLNYMHSTLVLPVNFTAAVFAALVTIYFWWENIKGIHESSEKALRIMYVTTVMVVIMIAWCGYTLYVNGAHLPPLPTRSTIVYSTDALGWLKHTSWPYTVSLIGILIGLGHSVLAMSGEETMAQVYREVEHPKLKNLEKAGFVIFLYSLIFTAGVAFFAVMIIPDSVRQNFFDNPIGGLAMYLVGPIQVRLIFRAFVVVVGTLMLAGAVNTAIVGSNGVMNRVSEDGILPDWFRHPHPRFGTSYRILNLVVGLQLLTIILSRGDIFVLGEAYAFGVMWSFAMKGLAVLVLRYKQPGKREFRVPLNLTVGGVEIPIGLGLITLVLFALCFINFFTKQVATVSGVAFTIIFFAVFTISERVTKKHGSAHADLDMFHTEPGEDLSPEGLGVRPGNVLVMVRNYNTLDNLSAVLNRVHPRERDVVVLHLRLVGRASSGEHELTAAELFSVNEQRLFTHALALAEKKGKSIHLAVAPATQKWDGILRAAQSLQSTTIALGMSSWRAVPDEARIAGLAWEGLPEPRPQLTLEIHTPGGQEHIFYLGPHAPRLTAKEIDLLHGLWLELSNEVAPEELHHHDVVHVALEELRKDILNGRRDEIVDSLRRHLGEIRDRRKSSS